MNREILFRGKKVENGKWVEGYFVNQDDPEYHVYIIKRFQAEVDNKYIDILECDIEEVIPETVGQYTGLTDKNGTKIFEGDILDISPYLIDDYAVVKFGEYETADMSRNYPCGHLGFYVTVPDKERYIRQDILYFAPECEVIGNIHDNPELLEVT